MSNELCNCCSAGLAAVRQQTQDFIQQYKQKLAEDFNQQGSGSSVSAEAVAPPVKTTKELLHPLSRPAVEVEAWRDPNAVVHKDSGPLPQVCSEMFWQSEQEWHLFMCATLLY